MIYWYQAKKGFIALYSLNVRVPRAVVLLPPQSQDEGA